jgi:CHAT domain-containing protein
MINSCIYKLLLMFFVTGCIVFTGDIFYAQAAKINSVDNISENNDVDFFHKFNRMKWLEQNISWVLNNGSGNINESVSNAKELVELSEDIYGIESEKTQAYVTYLARLYDMTANYELEERLLNKSLTYLEAEFGPNSIQLLPYLNNIARLNMTQTKLVQAENLLKKAINIIDNYNINNGNINNKDIIAIYNSMAVLYSITGKKANSKSYFLLSLKLANDYYGSNSDKLIEIINSVALYYLYDEQNYYEAEKLLNHALKINNKMYYNDNLYKAHILNVLSHIDMALNNLNKSEDKLNEVLNIYNKFNVVDTNSANTLLSLAYTYCAKGKFAVCSKTFNKALETSYYIRDNIFESLSEAQKINYLSYQASTIQTYISNTAQYMLSSPDVIADTFNAWLRWKGAVSEAQGRYQEAASRSDDPQLKLKFDKLTSVRRELGSLRLSRPNKLASGEYLQTITRLEKNKEALEAELSRLSKEFAVEKTSGRADVNTISALLPKDSIFIDFAKIRPYDFKQRIRGPEKYFAFILIPQKTPLVKLIEIADAASVDNLLKDYQHEMNRVKTQGIIPDHEAINKSTKAIYNVLFGKLEQYTADKKSLFISPDGTLNLIPFEILTTTDGKRLIEKHAISYVGAGRDIVRFTDTATTGATALIIADPDYNLGLEEKQQIASELKLTNSVHGSVTRDASKLSFTPLPDTKQEADAISKVLSDSMHLNVNNYQNKKALEDMLFAGKPPKIMHLATHGYFLNDEENQISSATTTRGLVIKEKTGLGYDDFVKIENPMLRSGIALAGVNRSLKEGRDDGLVSAEKILGLRLKGTDLVVLSACETGVGDVKNGEGVFGLKRAFILSGAKSLVMSLWSVPSAETTELMTDFYELMATGKTKSDALRQAKLNMMKKKPNPFYWGAFVLTGKPD